MDAIEEADKVLKIKIIRLQKELTQKKRQLAIERHRFLDLQTKYRLLVDKRNELEQELRDRHPTRGKLLEQKRNAILQYQIGLIEERRPKETKGKKSKLFGW